MYANESLRKSKFYHKPYKLIPVIPNLTEEDPKSFVFQCEDGQNVTAYCSQLLNSLVSSVNYYSYVDVGMIDDHAQGRIKIGGGFEIGIWDIFQNEGILPTLPSVAITSDRWLNTLDINEHSAIAHAIGKTLKKYDSWNKFIYFGESGFSDEILETYKIVFSSYGLKIFYQQKEI